MLHRPIYLLSFLFLSLQPDVAVAQEQALRLDTLIEEALAANPQIAMARGRSAAVHQQAAQAGALDDPMLEFGLLNVPESWDFNAEDMTSKEISLSQKVPFFGKRRLMRQAAEIQAEAVRWEIEDTINRITRDVRLVFFDLSHVHRAEDVTSRNKAILEDLSKLARTRYGVGQGIQEDIIRVEIEVSRMIDEQLMLRQRRATLGAALNTLLNRPTNHPLGIPEEWKFKAYDFDVETLQQAALDLSPVLMGVRKEIAVGEKNMSLARRDRVPDFTFKAAYGQRDNRPDMISATVEMNLPVFASSKQNRKVDEAAADLSARQALFMTARNDLFFMIADLVANAKRLEQRTSLYRTGIIPQANLQIQSAMGAYTVNKADFITLLDSRMRLFRFELEYHQAVAEYAKTIASLESAVGAPLAQIGEDP